jgi:glyoxylase-like metal-dependent hydrolase (beta-lactamase superfamily II)
MTAQPDASGEQASGGAGRKGPGAPAEGAVVGAAQRHAWLENLLPPVEEVRPGLWSIPVPWPGSGLRYTLAYLVSGRTGLALIDTGWPTEQAWTGLCDSITQTGHDITDLKYMLVTHAHSDHLGLAARVREASGALVGMHPAESATLRRAEPQDTQEPQDPREPQAGRALMPEWLRSRGAPDDEAGQVAAMMTGAVRVHMELARPDFDVEHGSLPLGAGTALRAVWTPGHTPGHLCFYDERQDVLLTGDHVLPRITPHIGLPPGAEGDPLGDYQDSLRALARYTPAEVLPAHEYRFADLGARLEMLLRHHQIRLAEIEHAVAAGPGLSTWDVSAVLTWSRGWDQTLGGARLSAVSETWAHLLHLQNHQRVTNQGHDRDSWVPGPRCSAPD